MVIAFKVLSHLVLVVAALGMLSLIVYVIKGGPIDEMYEADQETFMRALAAACGFLLYIGSRAVGLSLPSMMFSALSTSFPVVIGIAGIIFPSAVGVIISWYVINQIRTGDARRNAVAFRVLAMIVVFVFFLYCDSYAASFDSEARGELTYLLPNLSFVLSALLYAIFKFHPVRE